MGRAILKRKDLIYPDLSYTIIGILYEVYNKLGYGYKERYYQKAIAKEFKVCGLLFQEQVPAAIRYKDEIIGKLFLDFLIENKIVLEIKKTDRFSKSEISQITGYLKATSKKLEIIAHFTKDGIKFKRILNI